MSNAWSIEADETWSFVAKKTNKQWVGLALEAHTRQSSRKLWKKIPPLDRAHAVFQPDGCWVYEDVIAAAQHPVISKKTRNTHHVERFNCTLRQRVSRWVRATRSLSKTLDNFIGAIKYFICHSNLEVARALPLEHYRGLDKILLANSPKWVAAMRAPEPTR